MALNISEEIRLAREKNKLAKELANHREKISEKSDSRRTKYTTFLYKKKTEFSDRQFNQSMQRLEKIEKMRAK